MPNASRCKTTKVSPSDLPYMVADGYCDESKSLNAIVLNQYQCIKYKVLYKDFIDASLNDIVQVVFKNMCITKIN